MAHHFKEEDIDEFRECFFLFARNGQIRTLDELTVIMRSLGMSPTIAELKGYLKEKGKAWKILHSGHFSHHLEKFPQLKLADFHYYQASFGGKMSFPDFLKVMHGHSRIEKIPAEVIAAFKAGDRTKSGTISGLQLRHMLLKWGEQLSAKEVDTIFREANVTNNSMVKYEDFVKIVCAPVPDYY